MHRYAFTPNLGRAGGQAPAGGPPLRPPAVPGARQCRLVACGANHTRVELSAARSPAPARRGARGRAARTWRDAQLAEATIVVFVSVLGHVLGFPLDLHRGAWRARARAEGERPFARLLARGHAGRRASEPRVQWTVTWELCTWSFPWLSLVLFGSTSLDSPVATFTARAASRGRPVMRWRSGRGRVEAFCGPATRGGGRSVT